MNDYKTADLLLARHPHAEGCEAVIGACGQVANACRALGQELVYLSPAGIITVCPVLKLRVDLGALPWPHIHKRFVNELIRGRLHSAVYAGMREAKFALLS